MASSYTATQEPNFDIFGKTLQKSVVKQSIEKPILHNFVNLSSIFHSCLQYGKNTSTSFFLFSSWIFMIISKWGDNETKCTIIKIQNMKAVDNYEQTLNCKWPYIQLVDLLLSHMSYLCFTWHQEWRKRHLLTT